MLFLTGLSKTNLDFIYDFRGKFEHAMSIKEIEKLREKVEKDPNSKLYVPLAEEYRKEGRLEEAIEVLQKGIEKQPGYMSARVSLGKIYIEKGLINEARVEFESVVKSIPDNLYAHKKLAEIYRDTGERALAIKAFRTFLKLNPMDDEALNSLRDLEGTYAEQPVEKPQEHRASSAEATATEEEAPFEAMGLEHTPHIQPQRDAESGEELDAFKKSLFGGEAGPGEEIPEELLAVEEDITEAEEIPEGADEEWSFGEVENTPANEALEEDVTEAEEIPEDADEEWSFGDMADVLKAEQGEAAEETKTASEELFRAEMVPETAFKIPQDNSELLQTANGFISEGKYLGAINVYQQILATTPEDKQTLQRIEELRSLLKLMGKDKEVMISKLNSFLAAVKKRGDEFFRSS